MNRELIRKIAGQAGDLLWQTEAPPATLSNPPVVLITLPKSGSMYLFHTLLATYDLPTFQHFGGEFPNVELNRNLLHELVAQRGISQTHISASEHNLAVLDHFVDRAVLHVRDPRQALLSWVHSTETLLKDSPLDRELFGLNDAYYMLSLFQRISHEIETFLPAAVVWLQRWASVLNEARRCEMLVTRFEDMAADPSALACRIASYFQLPVADLASVDRQAAHFRAGQTSGGLCSRQNRWRARAPSSRMICCAVSAGRRILGKLPLYWGPCWTHQDPAVVSALDAGLNVRADQHVVGIQE